MFTHFAQALMPKQCATCCQSLLRSPHLSWRQAQGGRGCFVFFGVGLSIGEITVGLCGVGFAEVLGPTLARGHQVLSFGYFGLNDFSHRGLIHFMLHQMWSGKAHQSTSTIVTCNLQPSLMVVAMYSAHSQTTCMCCVRLKVPYVHPAMLYSMGLVQ